MPIITTNHAITYTNTSKELLKSMQYHTWHSDIEEYFN